MAKENKRVTELPQGFAQVNRPDLHGWVAVDAGVIVFGKIVGQFVMEAKKDDEKDTRILLVQLAQECQGVTSDQEKKTLMFKEGQVLGLSERQMIEEAFTYEAGSEIFIKFDKKVDLGGKRTTWKGVCGVKGKKLAPVGEQAPF
jgi:hypothetical protein